MCFYQEYSPLTYQHCDKISRQEVLFLHKIGFCSVAAAGQKCGRWRVRTSVCIGRCVKPYNGWHSLCMLLPHAHLEQAVFPLGLWPTWQTYQCVTYTKRSQWALDAALKRSITNVQYVRPVERSAVGVQEHIVMSKHFHYCSWQIWQLLSSNSKLQLHLKGVWIETDYLGSDSKLSLLSPQYNLLRFDGAAFNS